MALPKAKEIVSSNSVVVFRSLYLCRFPCHFCYVNLSDADSIFFLGTIVYVCVCSKSYCPFCVQVKQLFGNLGVSYKAIELDTEWIDLSQEVTVSTDGNEIQAALHEWTGQRTVPNVFIGGNHIGGCDTTTNLHAQGKLVPLLTSAGVGSKSTA
ncbi:Glutaredoxin-C2, partial [Mucuna pruriens]